MARQLQAGIERLDLRGVPLRDLPCEDAAQHVAGQVQLVRADLGDVDDRHDAGDDGRKHHEVVLLQLGRAGDDIGRAEVDFMRTL